MATPIQLDEILQILRIELSKKGSDALVTLHSTFVSNDEGATGTVSYAVSVSCVCAVSRESISRTGIVRCIHHNRLLGI